MDMESEPIESVVQRMMSLSQISELTANWRVEPKLLEDLLITSFKSIGIYTVKRQQIPMLRTSAIAILKYSPDIQDLVRKAAKEHQKRNLSRHAG